MSNEIKKLRKMQANDSLAESSLLQAKAMINIMIAEDRQIKGLMSMLTKPLKENNQ